jgi:hypothetical protein
MARRSRIVAFGSAAALVAAGVICAAVVRGPNGGVLAIALITLGLGGALLLVFLEVGLGEDRARAKDEQRRRERARQGVSAQRRPGRRWPRRPG